MGFLKIAAAAAVNPNNKIREMAEIMKKRRKIFFMVRCILFTKISY